MKRIMVLMTLVLLAFAVTDVIVPNEAQALMPLACTTAADYNWENRGWNTLCEWALQMDPGWNENNGSWEWTYLDEEFENDDNQSNPVFKNDAVYAMHNGEITKVIWYPLRT